jgi:Fe-S cluster assembly scaffold protein SufB
MSELLRTLLSQYPDARILGEPQTAHLVVDGREVCSTRTVPGVTIQAREGEDVVSADITVAAGIRVVSPIHTCVGVTRSHGSQHIRLRIRLGEAAAARVVTHCLFPNAERVSHVMEAKVELAAGAELRHFEGHYHGPFGGIEVRPQAMVSLGPHARYFSDFSLTTGRVGRLEMDYRVEAGAHAVAEIGARVFGHGSDRIRIKDEVYLNGECARGLVKTRVAVEDEAHSEVIGITHGNAAGTRGHMDCLEIVRGHALASAEPIVRVGHPDAKVTHEAAVGTVDRKQLETLMARGLTPEEAVEVVITGMLR